MKKKDINLFSIHKQKLFLSAMQSLCNQLSSAYFGQPLKKPKTTKQTQNQTTSSHFSYYKNIPSLHSFSGFRYISVFIRQTLYNSFKQNGTQITLVACPLHMSGSKIYDSYPQICSFLF